MEPEKLTNRDIHLAKVLNVKIEGEENMPATIENTENLPMKPLPENLNQALDESLNELEEILNKAKIVRDKSEEEIQQMGKPRDIEVFAKLTDEMVKVIKTKAELNIKKFKPEENENKNTKNEQNNIYVFDSRELNDMVKNKVKKVIEHEDI